MKKDLVEIVCIIDKSKSMELLKSEAISGFNSFINKQKELPGNAYLTLVQFNHEYELVYENEPIQDVKLLDDKTYLPDGLTALLDAVGKTINSIGLRLKNTSEDERPEKVIFCILTDGEENASKEYNNLQIKKMIEHQKEKYNWEFIFLAANQDAFATGFGLGINKNDTFNYTADAIGTQYAFTRMSDTVASYRKNVEED